MQTKLHVNLSQGILDIEGDASLVKEIYADFKERLLSTEFLASRDGAAQAQQISSPPKKKSKTEKRMVTTPKTGETGKGPNADKPQLDKNLDTHRLPEYYENFAPKNHPEKILIFMTFLVEELEILNPNTDQIFTCYEKVKERIPKAFAQAFRDASGKKFGYIDYNSSSDIQLTIHGKNHINHEMKV